MIEVILFGAFGGLSAFIASIIIRRGVTSRRFNVNPELDAPEPRRMVLGPRAPLAIEASVRSELDQTPEWWDGLFHAALEKSGASVVDVIEGDYIEQRSYSGGSILQYKTPDRYLYSECTCWECRRIVATLDVDI